jgi:hypothetical protein
LKKSLALRFKEARVEIQNSVLRVEGHLTCLNSKCLQSFKRREVRLKINNLLKEGPEKGMLRYSHDEMKSKKIQGEML